jgi:hypothetical protein
MMKNTSLTNKGVSELIAYVLLVTLAITVSIIVYGWLRLWVAPGTEAECPQGVNVIITDYTCGMDKLDITIKNKGRFSVHGYFVRVHNVTDPKFGLYTLNNPAYIDNLDYLPPGEERTRTYSLIKNPEISIANMGKITLIEVQPFVQDEVNRILCEDYTSIKIENCSVA